MTTNINHEQKIRISEAMDHLDQANTIFNFFLFSRGGFEGTGDPKWDHRLAATVNVSNLLNFRSFETNRETIGAASEEITLRRLPRLLCIAMVSALETCFQDLSEIQIRGEKGTASEEEIMKDVRKLNSGGPLQYLPKLAERLSIPVLATSAWDWYTELVATRNILVHASEPVADERYVRNAGPSVRVAAGQALSVDNSYLLENYASAKVSLMDILRVGVEPAVGMF